MECPRCNGLMVMDVCMDREGAVDSIWLQVWRCLNCGELFDQPTLENRKQSGVVSPNLPHAPGHTRKIMVVLSS